MRVVFMGTDRFAVPALRAVINSEVELACVITQPDRPKGRRLRTTSSPVKEVALRNNLLIYQPKRVREREFVEEVLESSKPDLIIVAAFGQILPKAILDTERELKKKFSGEEGKKLLKPLLTDMNNISVDTNVLL